MSIRAGIFNSLVPVSISPPHTHKTLVPYYACLPRISYITIHIPHITKYFNQQINEREEKNIKNIQNIQFKEDIYYHTPIGVLYDRIHDMEATQDVVWNIQAESTDEGDLEPNTRRKMSAEDLYSHYIAQLKQVCAVV